MAHRKNKPTHDAFVKKFMSRKEVATEFFEGTLPSHILDNADLTTLKQEKTDFLDNTLGHGIVDMLYSVKIRDSTGYISLLLEHQSRPEKFMAFRIMKYVLSICDAHLKKYPKSKFPVIHPMIFYTGERKYNSSLSFWDLFVSPELIKKSLCRDSGFSILSLREIKDIDLKKRYRSGVMLYLMSKIFKKDIMPFLDVMRPALYNLSKEGFQYVEDVLYYVLENAETERKESVLHFFEESVSEDERGNVMTIAEQLRAEGIEQGILQGRQEGMQEEKMLVVKNLLARGVDMRIISSATGLDISEIEKIES